MRTLHGLRMRTGHARLVRRWLGLHYYSHLAVLGREAGRGQALLSLRGGQALVSLRGRLAFTTP